MASTLHPEYTTVKVNCVCGNSFETKSTIKNDILKIEICSNCHPFYTGKQNLIDTTGRIEKFKTKYKIK